jgi:hypothetical protein
VDVVGPLSERDLEANLDRHQLPGDELPEVIGRYKKIYAWVLSDIKRFETPIEYHHPQGAVVWVRVGDWIELGDELDAI